MDYGTKVLDELAEHIDNMPTKDYRKLYEEALKDIDLNLSGSCMISSEKISKALSLAGKDHLVIEGWVQGDDGDMFNHTWIELIDGTIIDETLGQFDKYCTIVKHLKDEAAIFTPKEYVRRAKKHPVDETKYYKRTPVDRGTNGNNKNKK